MTPPSPTIEQQPTRSTLLPSASWSTRALGEASSRYHVLVSSFPAPPPPPPAALFPLSNYYKFSKQTLTFITLSLLLLRTRKEISFDYGFLFWLTFSNLPDLTTPPTSDASFPPLPPQASKCTGGYTNAHITYYPRYINSSIVSPSIVSSEINTALPSLWSLCLNSVCESSHNTRYEMLELQHCVLMFVRGL